MQRAADWASDRAVTRAMALKSLAALALLAALGIASLLIFGAQTETIESAARVVNVAGRQRMLSQRTALLADRLVATADAAVQAAVRTELLATVERMEKAHRGLMYGDLEMQLPPAPPAVLELYFQPPDSLNLQIIDYVTAVRELCRVDATSAERQARLDAILAVAYRGSLLAKLDAATNQLQEHNEGNVARLRRANYLVFGLILATLATTGLLVFRPMLRSVERHLAQLRESEHRLGEVRARLTHVTRLGTLGEMAAGLAHEINQPLTAIATYSQACRRLLAAGKASPEDLQTTLSKVSAQAHRGGEVIRRLRAFGKDGDRRRELAELNVVVDESVQLAEADVRYHRFRIEKDFPTGLPPVIVDTVQIQQVVLNLIRNGIDATDPASDVERVIRVSTALDSDEQLVVAVRDPGSGIADADRPQLFEPFFTTKESGMGVGLSISRSIITSHGGRLWFENNRQGGATFRFSLPTADAPARTDSLAGVAASPAQAPGRAETGTLHSSVPAAGASG